MPRGWTGVLAVVLSGIVAVTTAAEPNFSGTWVRDKDKSDPMGMGMRAGGPGGPGREGSQPRPRGDAMITLVVKHSGNDLAVERRVSFGGQERPPLEQKFTLDGRENSNPTFGRGGQGVLKSKSKLNNGKVVIDGSSTMSTPQGDFDIGTHEEWELSADAKLLTITTTRSTPMGDNTSRQVYNKQ